jgi:hypothetical protein
MSSTVRPQTDVYRAATLEDIRHVFGELDDHIVANILAVQPTYRELSDAAIWVRGDGDLIAREHRELSANALAVAELFAQDDEQSAD